MSEEKVNLEVTTDGVDRIAVEIINRSNNELPKYSDPGSSGMDVRAFISEAVVLKPGETTVIPTGLYVSIPLGYECQVRPRSGLSAKHSISVLNSPGTVDSSYKGEIGVILHNYGRKYYIIEPGDRIAQLVFARYAIVTFKSVEVLSGPDRGGGFGHSGVK